MESAQSRPPFGEVYRPQRQALSEDNAYLSSIGLIILIRGSPSAALPHLIATKFAQIHGGYPNDYAVSQATITPYLVTCLTPQIRDTVVQHGIYSIPQAQLQFVVHEWRPRFGMGYDPPQYRVWIKVVGLPLQAWTSSEITQFLQHFGYPLEIVPFGQAAGHFRDITALVAVKCLDSIPHAYSYKEGDYSTRVEIFLLSWRSWDQGYFPPPGGRPLLAGPRAQTRQAGDWYAQAHSSSPSSASNVPSEPTIDLSAWSPRSHRSHQARTQGQVRNPPQSAYPQTPPQDSSRSLLIHQPPPELTLPLSSDCSCLTLLLHGRCLVGATENPSDTHKICSPIRLELLSVPSPIPLRLLPFPLTLTLPIGTLGEIALTPRQGRENEMRIYALTSVLRLGGKEAINEMQIGIATGEELSGKSKKFLETHKAGPAKSPKAHLQATSAHLRGSKLSAQTLDPSGCTFSLALIEGPTSHHALSLCPLAPPQLRESLPDPFPITYDPTLPVDPQLLMREDPHVLIEAPANPNSDTLSLLIHPTTTDLTPPPLPATLPLPSMPTVLPCRDPKPKLKEMKLATRKSQRLQAKKRPSYVSVKSPVAPRNKIAKLPFDTQSLEQPIGVETALTILQASGLTINKEIEEMLQKVIVFNQHADSPQETRPTTPVHNIIPPRAMLGNGIVL